MTQTVAQFVERWLERNVDSAGITTAQGEAALRLAGELERAAAEAGVDFNEVERYLGDVETAIRLRIDILYDEQA